MTNEGTPRTSRAIAEDLRTHLKTDLTTKTLVAHTIGWAYGVNHNVASHALRRLESAGVIARDPGVSVAGNLIYRVVR